MSRDKPFLTDLTNERNRYIQKRKEKTLSEYIPIGDLRARSFSIFRGHLDNWTECLIIVVYPLAACSQRPPREPCSDQWFHQTLT